MVKSIINIIEIEIEIVFIILKSTQNFSKRESRYRTYEDYTRWRLIDPLMPRRRLVPRVKERWFYVV